FKSVCRDSQAQSRRVPLRAGARSQARPPRRGAAGNEADGRLRHAVRRADDVRGVHSRQQNLPGAARRRGARGRGVRGNRAVGENGQAGKGGVTTNSGAATHSIPPPQGEGGRPKADRVGFKPSDVIRERYKRTPLRELEAISSRPTRPRCARPPSPFGGGIGVCGSARALLRRPYPAIRFPSPPTAYSRSGSNDSAMRSPGFTSAMSKPSLTATNARAVPSSK